MKSGCTIGMETTPMADLNSRPDWPHRRQFQILNKLEPVTGSQNIRMRALRCARKARVPPKGYSIDKVHFLIRRKLDSPR